MAVTIDVERRVAPTTAVDLEDTLVGHFRRQLREQPDRPALHWRAGDSWTSITWREYGHRARRLGAYLVAQGVGEAADGHVAIWGNNRPEWLIASTAILGIRGRPVPVYQTLSAEQAAYVLGHSEAIVAVVETPAELAKIVAVRSMLPALRRVVLMEGEVPPEAADVAVTWDRAQELGEQALASLEPELERRARAVTLDDVATLIYTSGTTGPPKAVVATHRNMVEAAKGLGPIFNACADDVVVSYLPLAHIVERIDSECRQDFFGNPVWFCHKIAELPEVLKEVRPTFFFAVPRVYEKMADVINRTVDASPPVKRALARWAIGVGGAAADVRQAGRTAGWWLRARHAIADRLVLAKVRATLGLDRAVPVSGAAPIAVDLLRFYQALGVRVCEGYGMSENMATTTLNRPGQERLGTVGPAVPGVDIAIAPDGEILMRGPTVMTGYYKDPEATAETLVDGWLHTGDVGVLDEDGFLRITDRKKDLIITAGGKNIAPTNIETALKAHPLVANAVAIGDRRPFVSALLTLDPDAAQRFAAEHAIDPVQVVAHPLTRAEIERHVHDVNGSLAHVEQVKRWTILPDDFIVGEELTPTYKVRRKVVTERYAQTIEGMYTVSRES